MSAKIIIVGTCHSLQCGVGDYSESQREKYKNLILDLCVSHQVKLIAEEMTLQGIKDRGADTTIAIELAKNNLGVTHKFVEIEEDIRAKLHLDRASLAKIAPIFNETPQRKTEINDKLEKLIFFPARECCWLATILYEKRWPTLLICGEAHVSGMQRLIRKVNRRSLVCSILTSDYLSD